jgi:Domain of unknown function (DUF397)
VDGVQPDGLAWRRSSTCNGGACVELATLGETITLRSSTDPAGTVLTFSRDEWEHFVAAIMGGLFDEF